MLIINSFFDIKINSKNHLKEYDENQRYSVNIFINSEYTSK